MCTKLISSRYCISCNDDSRLVQKTEENFFSNLEELVGKIPVIVVFTKYDKIIGKVYAGWQAKNRRRLAKGEISEQTMYGDVRTTADARYKRLFNERWGFVINPLSVPSLRMVNIREKQEGNQVEEDDDDEEALGEDLLGESCEAFKTLVTDELAIYPEVGVEALTKMTLQNLENHNIKILWATAQNNSADLTSERKSSCLLSQNHSFLKLLLIIHYFRKHRRSYGIS